MFSKALDNVTVLNTDPGGYLPSIALFNNGVSASLPSFARSISDARSLGLKLGFDTITKISPVLGFNATTEPLLFPRALYATLCNSRSNVVIIPLPIFSSSEFNDDINVLKSIFFNKLLKLVVNIFDVLNTSS